MAKRSSNPQQKSITENQYVSSYLNRNIPNYTTPDWLSATRWRSIVRNQPLAVNCRSKLITSLQNTPWKIHAKKTSDQESLESDIQYYTHLLENADNQDFDAWLDRVWQDALDLPQGGNTEIVRWPVGYKPEYSDGENKYQCTRNHPMGHVHKIVHMDGATIYPTYDDIFPLAQVTKSTVVNGDPSGYDILFKPEEFSRILLSPRPEITRRGYGMPPPEKAYLAFLMLYNGDSFYNRLLVDTPEAGILDLMDMEEDSAIEWLEGLRDLFAGIDPFKIPVLYNHDIPAKWIPFTRPPSEISYNEITMKYAKVLIGSYWLRVSDVGIGQDTNSLAGQIRDERSMRLTGFGIVREKTRNMINRDILPPYLKFVWIENDEEALIQRARARLLMGQAVKTLIEAQTLKPEDAQKMLMADGLIPEEAELPPPPPPEGNEPNPSPQITSEKNNAEKTPEKVADRQVENEVRKKEATQGGVGESTGRIERSYTTLIPHETLNPDKISVPIFNGKQHPNLE